MRRTCFYHAGCPDGLGAAWAVWRAWGPGARYLPRGHDDVVDAAAHEGSLVVFVDIAPGSDELRALAEHAAKLIVLDHHVTARERFANDLGLAECARRARPSHPLRSLALGRHARLAAFPSGRARAGSAALRRGPGPVGLEAAGLGGGERCARLLPARLRDLGGARRDGRSPRSPPRARPSCARTAARWNAPCNPRTRSRSARGAPRR